LTFEETSTVSGTEAAETEGAPVQAGGPTPVLVVDDDAVHSRQLEVILGRWGYRVLTARNGREALRLLAEEGPVQLVVADWMMPEMDGLELCGRIRSDFTDPYVYVILVTARDRRDDIVAGLDAGADDYLAKPIHHGELRARIRAGERIIDLQNRLLAAQERLRVEATHDALTGLWNRRAILANLERELHRAGREGSSIAVALIDLDHFKSVNDTHGHLVGDEVLRETARRLGGAVRPYDFVGRYGGEEFLVVAPGYDHDRALALAERIRRAFDSTPITTSGPVLPLTLSLGMVAVRGSAEISDVLAAADGGLYEAKEAGRNTSRLREM
jgi:diguanylate cyclase (GGDEF)-like protein